MSSQPVYRTVVSPQNTAMYYVGEDSNIVVSSYVLSTNQVKYSISNTTMPTHTGELGEVEIITTGIKDPTRIASGVIQLNEKLPSLNRPAYRNNSHRILIRNFTRFDVHTVDRNGIKVTERATVVPGGINKQYQSQHVVIREEYYYETCKAAMASLNLLKASMNLKGLVALKMRDILETTQKVMSLGCCISVEYLIHESKLLDAGVIYHTQSDRVLSFTDNPELLEHPCSPDYVPAPLINGPIGDKDMYSTFRYVSDRVDAQPLYVRQAGQIIKLSPSISSGDVVFTDSSGANPVLEQCKEYVMVTMQNNTIHAAMLARPGSTGPATVIVRPFIIPVDDKMEKYGIFRTEVDATREFADLNQKERKHEEAISGLKSKYERLEIQLDDKCYEYRDLKTRTDDKIEDLKLDIRKQAIAHKEEIDRKDLIIEELKKSNHKEIEELKEKREQSVHKTKTFHDYVKIFFAVVAGVLAVIPVYLKFRAANPIPLPV